MTDNVIAWNLALGNDEKLIAEGKDPLAYCRVQLCLSWAMRLYRKK